MRIRLEVISKVLNNVLFESTVILDALSVFSFQLTYSIGSSSLGCCSMKELARSLSIFSSKLCNYAFCFVHKTLTLKFRQLACNTVQLFLRITKLNHIPLFQIFPSTRNALSESRESILVDLRVTIGPRPTNVILQLQSASRETGSKRLLKRVREPSVETKTKATAKDTEGNIQIAILKA
ncbi:hypothetical protein V6N11_052213 [Hibiscus sabdariffa]|uniref:Uncharacterized protein n=1 Tax=Hibiscus sabdariffa TaxID=183260 RepID=A0ABR2U9F8_9ROSI